MYKKQHKICLLNITFKTHIGDFILFVTGQEDFDKNGGRHKRQNSDIRVLHSRY